MSRALFRATGVRLLAESPEDVYRIPEWKRPFAQILPLPRYMTHSLKKRRLRPWMKKSLGPPKPTWFNEMNQSQLYLSVLKYTEFQLTDEKLYKDEEYTAMGKEEGLKDERLAVQLSLSVVQPAFSDLQPDQQYFDKSLKDLPHSLQMMMEDLQKAGPALLPHPALALHGEALIKNIITDFIVDIFPRLHSNHLLKIVSKKSSLTNLVNAATRSGLARGMGLGRETILHQKITHTNLVMERNNQKIDEAKDLIRRGSLTENLQLPDINMKQKFITPLGEKHVELLEDRMKLLSRHLAAFLAYASFVKGESFAKAFVVRYFLPDIALQHFSTNPEMRAWLEVNNKWKFLPRNADRSSSTELMPRVSTADHVPMVIDGVETSTSVVAGSVREMLASGNPMKELALILQFDAVSQELFNGARPQYRLLFEGHKEATGTKFTRVGVYARSNLLAEGEGVDYELACKAAAQTALHSYYMNPKSNYTKPQQKEEKTKKRKKKKSKG